MGSLAVIYVRFIHMYLSQDKLYPLWGGCSPGFLDLFFHVRSLVTVLFRALVSFVFSG